MKKGLSTLLTAVGLSAVGAVVYMVNSGVTPKQLKKAGIDSCPSISLACDVLEGKTYRRRPVPARDCRDAGMGFILTAKQKPNFVDGTCAPTSDGSAEELPLECACRTQGASCFLPDAGLAPYGKTLQPGWSGDGCKRKACIELLGSTSWPKECPGG